MELSRRIRWRNWEGSRSVVRRSENRANKPGRHPRETPWSIVIMGAHAITARRPLPSNSLLRLLWSLHATGSLQCLPLLKCGFDS